MFKHVIFVPEISIDGFWGS